MTDRWSQPKARHLDLHGKVDDYARKKSSNKDTQERDRTTGLLTTTNIPKKRQDAPFDELHRTMKAQSHGSPTQSKLIRPCMSPLKPKGIPIDVPKTTFTKLDRETPTSPLQRNSGSVDRVRASPSPKKSVSRPKERITSIPARSAVSPSSTEHSKHDGANRPLSRTVIDKPRLLLEKAGIKPAAVGSRRRRKSEDYGSDESQGDRPIGKTTDTTVDAVKSTSRSFKEDENLRRLQDFFVEIGLQEKPKDYSEMSKSQPPKSQERLENTRTSLPNSQSRAKEGSQRRMEDRNKATRVMGSKKKSRSPSPDVVEILDEDSNHLTRSSPATKRTRSAQSCSDSELEKESKPKSGVRSDARSRILSPPVQAHTVAPKATSDRFTLPSPSKKKSCYESPSGYMSNQIIYMLSDEDIPRKAVDDDNVCPYCGDPLPKKKSLRLTKALEKIHADQKRHRERKQEKKKHREHGFVQLSADLMIQESPSKSMPRPRPKRREKKAADAKDGKKDSDSDSRRRRESEHRDYDPFGFPPPSSSLSSPPKDKAKLSLMDRFEFCRVHIADEQIIPHGMENGYPMVIDFPGLYARVKMMEPELRGIVDGSVPSPFLEKALSNYKRMGVIGARNPHVVLAGIQQTLPGYYGSKGSSELFKILARLFLESQFLTHEKANPQKPSEYIQHVLVPEAGVRLIAEDRNKLSSGDPISFEAAREIMMESVEFGSYVHDIELYS